MKLHLVGYASGVGGVDIHTGDGPTAIKQSPHMLTLQDFYQWDAMIHPPVLPSHSIADRIHDLSMRSAKVVSALTHQQQFFTVIGGDHTSAIGTWSGVYDALHDKGDIGLIWIDAHMDSHTPHTSATGRIHGMPLACLLGHGYDSLTQILHASPKIKPANLCLIGTRSYEQGEAELLARLNVRIYFIEEVRERGFAAVLREAIQHVSKHTIGYGVSLDMDAIDTLDAPAVDVPEPDGIEGQAVLAGLAEMAHDAKFVGMEMVEFDPYRDDHQTTEKLMVSFLEAVRMSRKK